jgi:hypothetical protein
LPPPPSPSNYCNNNSNNNNNNNNNDKLCCNSEGNIAIHLAFGGPISKRAQAVLDAADEAETDDDLRRRAERGQT